MTRELAMVGFDSVSARGGGFLGCGSVAAPNELSSFDDARLPFPVMRAIADTNKSASVIRLHFAIAAIFALGAGSQIVKTVVGRVAIFVVDYVGRICPGHNQPREAVSRIASIIKNPDLDIAANATSRRLPSMFLVPSRQPLRIVAPFDYARFRVVIENGFNEFRGKLSLLLDRHDNGSCWRSGHDLTRLTPFVNI